MNTCAVAALRTVLDLQYGVQLAEEALEILGTDPHEPIKRLGTSTDQLRRMVKGASLAVNGAAPWRLRVRRVAELQDLVAELETGRYPMVGVHEPNDVSDYHMVVVLAVDADRVQVWDPSPNAASRPKWLSLLEFLEWWGGDGEMTWCAVVKGRYRPAKEVVDV